MCIHLKIKVTGKVQGVWFRKYTKDKAVEMGIKGFVQNKPDGSVYVEAEAEEQTIRNFLKWLETGSPLSDVDEVIPMAQTKCSGFKSFEIR